jgi:hypothetical protein
MSLTPEQRAIAARLGDLSREYEQKLRSNPEQNMELLDIFRRRNDAFAEFIDTL